GIPEGAPLILNVGSYRPVKGQLTFVQACQRVIKKRPDVHCALVGEMREPVLGHIQRQMQEGGAKNIHLLPPTSRMPAVYPRASLLVVSSHFEGFSNTILEAGASGVPVVATRVGGNPEAVESGVDGILVPPKNPEAMARAILDLLADPKKRTAMGQAARRKVHERFSLEKMVQTMERHYITWLETHTHGH
ncbi:MAG: glycosyltransferase, partial [Calditrichaeota bacterium]|nr:glycosyltransferase [Calditrichota bacterium]